MSIQGSVGSSGEGRCGVVRPHLSDPHADRSSAVCEFGVHEGEAGVGIGFGQALAEAQELVAAESHDHVVAPQVCCESVRDRDEQSIAGVVSERIVHRFEPVDIDEDEREWFPGPVRPCHLSLQLDEPGATTVSAGEVVEVCDPAVNGGGVPTQLCGRAITPGLCSVIESGCSVGT